MTSKAPGSGTSISSTWNASLGSPKRSSRITHAAIVAGSWPGSVLTSDTRCRSIATGSSSRVGYWDGLAILPAGRPRGPAPLHPPHQAQPGPVLIQRRHLHVDQAQRQRQLADVLLADVAVAPVGSPRPRDPHGAVGKDPLGERREALAHTRQRREEGDDRRRARGLPGVAALARAVDSAPVAGPASAAGSAVGVGWSAGTGWDVGCVAARPISVQASSAPSSARAPIAYRPFVSAYT